MIEKIANTLKRVIYPITDIFKYGSLGLIAVLMLLITTDVILRYVFHLPIRGSYELVEQVFLVAIVFMGLAYTQSIKSHLSVDTLTSHLSPGANAVVNTAVNLISTGIYGIITWRTFIEAGDLRVAGQLTGVLPIPTYPIMYLVSIGSGLLSLTYLTDFFISLSDTFKKLSKPWLWLGIAGLAVIVLVAMPVWLNWLPWHIDRLSIGVLGMLLMTALLFSNAAIGIVMVLTGFLCLAYLSSWTSGVLIMGMSAYTATVNYTLSTLPLFVLMGTFIANSEVSRDIFNSANKWIGQLPGGLAMASIAACAGFAAICGTGPATSLTIGMNAIPEMRRYKYADSMACGAVAVGGTLGILIPPSMGFIIYGIITGESIGKLFIAGIIPGVVLAIMMMLTIYFQVKLNRNLAPPAPRVSFKEKITAFKGVWAALLLFLLVMGGIYMGVFTTTEAAGIGAFGALLIGLVKRTLGPKKIVASLADTVSLTCMAFLMMIGFEIFGQFVTVSRLPDTISNFISSLHVPSMVVMIVILLFYLFLGSALEVLPTLFVTLPILYPIVMNLGYDPLWFGVVTVIMTEIGSLSPPVAINVFILQKVVPDVSVGTMYRGTYPFYITFFVFIVILLAFPQIATYLPGVMK